MGTVFGPRPILKEFRERCEGFYRMRKRLWDDRDYMFRGDAKSWARTQEAIAVSWADYYLEYRKKLVSEYGTKPEIAIRYLETQVRAAKKKVMGHVL